VLVVQRWVRLAYRVRFCAARRGWGDSSTIAWHTRPSILTKALQQTRTDITASLFKCDQGALRPR